MLEEEVEPDGQYGLLAAVAGKERPSASERDKAAAVAALTGGGQEEEVEPAGGYGLEAAVAGTEGLGAIKRGKAAAVAAAGGDGQFGLAVEVARHQVRLVPID